ncbi:hydrogenase maturation nickel metallochaperone HypA [Thermodesulfobacteriota bacterium]
MHELGIAQSIIEIAIRVAKENGSSRISVVRIQAGEFRGIIQEQLEFSFAFAAEGTMAEGAKLEVEVIPIEARCESCGEEFRVKNFHFQCLACESEKVRVLGGDELTVKDLELY